MTSIDWGWALNSPCDVSGEGKKHQKEKKMVFCTNRQTSTSLISFLVLLHHELLFFSAFFFLCCLQGLLTCRCILHQVRASTNEALLKFLLCFQPLVMMIFLPIVLPALMNEIGSSRNLIIAHSNSKI